MDRHLPTLACLFALVVSPLLIFYSYTDPHALEVRTENRIFWPAMALITLVLTLKNLPRTRERPLASPHPCPSRLPGICWIKRGLGVQPRKLVCPVHSAIHGRRDDHLACSAGTKGRPDAWPVPLFCTVSGPEQLLRFKRLGNVSPVWREASPILAIRGTSRVRTTLENARPLRCCCPSMKPLFPVGDAH